MLLTVKFAAFQWFSVLIYMMEKYLEKYMNMIDMILWSVYDTTRHGIPFPSCLRF